MVPLQVFPGYPPTGLSTYRVLLPRSLALTITLVLIRTVVAVVDVVVNIDFQRNKLLILLAVPAVLAVILLVLPAVLAVLLLVLLVLLTSQIAVSGASYLAFQTGDCLLLIESSAESSCNQQ